MSKVAMLAEYILRAAWDLTHEHLEGEERQESLIMNMSTVTMGLLYQDDKEGFGVRDEICEAALAVRKKLVDQYFEIIGPERRDRMLADAAIFDARVLFNMNRTSQTQGEDEEGDND